MPDIALCTNELCPLRNECYRALAKPSEYLQSYSRFEFGITKHMIPTCEYFIKSTNESENKKH